MPAAVQQPSYAHLEQKPQAATKATAAPSASSLSYLMQQDMQESHNTSIHTSVSQSLTRLKAQYFASWKEPDEQWSGLCKEILSYFDLMLKDNEIAKQRMSVSTESKDDPSSNAMAEKYNSLLLDHYEGMKAFLNTSFKTHQVPAIYRRYRYFTVLEAITSLMSPSSAGYTYRDPASQTTVSQALALVWLAIKDETNLLNVQGDVKKASNPVI